MTMFIKLNFWPLQKAPGAGDPKNCACACAIHVSNYHTKSGWISEKKKFDPPRYPQVPPLGMTQAAEWKSHLICYISFICEKIHKVWFKNLWNWLCNSDLIIFDLLASPQGPRGWGPQKMVPLHMPFVLVTHTPNLVEFRKNFFWPHKPPRYHQVPPLGHDPGGQMKILSDMSRPSSPDHFFGRVCFPPCPFFSFRIILLFTLILFNLPKFIDAIINNTRCACHQ